MLNKQQILDRLESAIAHAVDMQAAWWGKNEAHHDYWLAQKHALKNFRQELLIEEEKQ